MLDDSTFECCCSEVVFAVVISKTLKKEALGATTPIFWVWLSGSHAHIFNDGNMVIYLNTDNV